MPNFSLVSVTPWLYAYTYFAIHCECISIADHCACFCTSIDDDSRTEWERQREREEFARTARVVQPLGSSLTSRFTRSQEEASTKEPAEEEVSSLCSSVLNCLFTSISCGHVLSLLHMMVLTAGV